MMKLNHRNADRSNGEPESAQHLASSSIRDSERSTIELRDDPPFPERDLQHSRSQCPSKMRSPFTPVHTRVGEAAPQIAHCRDIYPQLLKSCRALRCEIAVVMARAGREPAERPETIMQQDPQRAGNMIVTSARQPQSLWSARREFLRGFTCDHTECL